MTTMDPNIKKTWVDALRSGEYKQGGGYLSRFDVTTNETYYCCLGVLCDIAAKAGAVSVKEMPEDEASTDDIVNVYDDDYSLLPKSVALWAGLGIAISPEVIDPRSNNTRELADLNDSGYSFEEIANLIDSEL